MRRTIMLAKQQQATSSWWADCPTRESFIDEHHKQLERLTTQRVSPAVQKALDKRDADAEAARTPAEFDVDADPGDEAGQ